MSANHSFLSTAQQGRNGWQRYLLGILIIIGIPIFSFSVYAYFLNFLLGTPPDEIFQISFKDPFLVLVIAILFFLSCISGLYIATEKIHKRAFENLLGPEKTIVWIKIVKGFTTWFFVYFVTWLVLYLINPYRYQFTLSLSDWLPLTLAYLVFSILCSFVYILFVYGYLLQGISLFIRNRVVSQK